MEVAHSVDRDNDPLQKEHIMTTWGIIMTGVTMLGMLMHAIASLPTDTSTASEVSLQSLCEDSPEDAA